MTTMNDNVSHPAHYTSGRIEVIDFIDDKELSFCLGNVVKYVARAGKKKSAAMSDRAKQIEDLRKACWYLTHEIERLEAEDQDLVKN